MIENIKKVSNPLTIIAIFAGLAEIAGTVALPLILEINQSLFIWYVMGFPILLVIAFFITLNFNPKVLYSPSDYSNEDNFMVALEKRVRAEKRYKDIDRKIEETKTKVDEIPKNQENSKIVEDLNKNIDKISKMINFSRQETENLINLKNANFGYRKGSVYDKVMRIIYSVNEISEEEIGKMLSLSKLKLNRVLNNLCEQNVIEKYEDSGLFMYRSKF